MALSRRTGARFQTSIWPGFVDAMTGLLLVLMFLLTIFMVVQFVLRETISGQESELDALSTEVRALAAALGLEERRNSQLTERLGALDSTLNRTQTDLDQARADLAAQTAAIAGLTAERDRQARALDAARARITDFEAQVAGLLADRDRARQALADLSSDRDALLTEQEALNLALAQSRAEIDAQAEAARLAAARREALEAMVAELREQGERATAEIADLRLALDDEQAARLTDAAAAEALRERLENADAELTAMTLSLEARRREAEETLTLLAAAEAARKTLDARLAEALARIDAARAETGARDALVGRLTRVLSRLQADKAETARTLDALRAQLSQQQADGAATEDALRAQLAQAQAAQARLQSELDGLRADLSAARDGSEAAAQDRAALETRLLRALEDLERAQAAASDRELLQARLAAALAARDEAETGAAEERSLAEQRAALLAQARDTLAREKRVSADAQRQTALLNQQVAALRAQLGGLQALLDDFEERDAAAKVQLQTLGADLNAALARAASEERKRRLLEEAERQRLQEEARALAARAEELSAQTLVLERYRSEFFGRLRDVLGDQEGLRIEGDRFVFSSEVLFAPGQARLSPEGRAEVAKVAAILRGVAADIPPELDWVIRVDGHTDDVPMVGGGRYRDNWELSQGRALSVVRYMADALGIPPQRLSANGFGQFQPVNPADTPEARAQNRRIELKLTEK